MVIEIGNVRTGDDLAILEEVGDHFDERVIQIPTAVHNVVGAVGMLTKYWNHQGGGAQIQLGVLRDAMCQAYHRQTVTSTAATRFDQRCHFDLRNQST